MAQFRTGLRKNLGLESGSLDAAVQSASRAVVRIPMGQHGALQQSPQMNFSLDKVAESRHTVLANKRADIQTIYDQQATEAEPENGWAELSEDLANELPPVSSMYDSDVDFSTVVISEFDSANEAESVLNAESVRMLDESAELFASDPQIEKPEFVAAFSGANSVSRNATETIESESPLDFPEFPSVPSFEDEFALDSSAETKVDYSVEAASSEEAPETVGDPVKPNVVAKRASFRKQKQSDTFAWAYPQGLINEIQPHKENPLTASWAHSTIQILNELKYLNDLADENILIILDQLVSQVEQLDFLATQASTIPVKTASYAQGRLASELRQLRYSIERRLQVWPVVHELAKRPTERIGMVNNNQVGQFLLASSYRLNTESVDSGWANYLKLDAATQVFNSLNSNDFAKKKAARSVLARLYSPSLNNVQRQYLESAIDDQTINILRVCATDKVDLEQLVKRIEKFEENKNGASQFYLNDSYQSLLWSDNPGYHELAQRLQTHYRNANFRVSVSDKLLNRMVPQQPTMSQPYRDRILGADVVGRNRISNQLQISLIPDPDQISMKLETYGKVDSRTTASRSGIVVENEGTSRFRIIKRLAFGQQGIFAYRPQTTSQVAQRVVGLRSNLDKIPPLGWVARRIAENKIAEQAPATKRYTQQQLETQAENIFNREVEKMLHELETSLTTNLLHPLIAMDLEPDPVQISTTTDRINMRYRMAGRDQMGANTARPRGVQSSLFSMQIHQSLINNTLSRFELASKKFTTEELADYINQTLGEGFVELDTSKSQKPAKFEFAPFEPVRIEFEEQKIAITISLKSFQIGKGKRWRNLIIKSTYDPYVVSGFNIGLVQSEEGLRVKGRRLNVGDQLAIGVICEVLFPEQFQLAMMPSQLAQQLKISNAETSQFVVSNGWIGVSVDDGQSSQASGYPPQSAAQPLPIQNR